MSHFEFNAALGREVEFYKRVNDNDPANSAFILMLLALAGLEGDEVLRDMDTFAAIVAGTTNEATNTGYARKTLTDADLAAYTVDDTADSVTLAIPSQTFGPLTAGDTIAKAVLGFDADTTAGTDADIIPMFAYDTIIGGSHFVPAGDSLLFDLSAGYVVISSRP